MVESVVDGEPRQAEFLADRESPGKARRFAAEFAIACGADPHAVALSVSEAVTNAVRHGYRERTDLGPIRIELSIVASSGDLQICVVDHGQGLAYRVDSPGMGLGMPLIAAMAERMEIETGESGTRVCMCFPTSIPAACGPRGER
jgi:anti-sigma regulatory factor (Ser/Thr protein kinase)